MLLRVVLDANVLFPFTLRDTLLRAAAVGFFQVYWSEQILDEAGRNLMATGRMTQAQVHHLMTALSKAFPEALVSGHEPFIAQMLNHKKDRHVAAAAFKADAGLIVTSNLKDFRKLPEGLKAISPDLFLLGLLEQDPGLMLALLQNQARALERPPVTFDELLTGLARSVPRFAQRVGALLPADD